MENVKPCPLIGISCAALMTKENYYRSKIGQLFEIVTEDAR